ncbi:hypothetical protein MY5147_001131 [Beauveria neobassiana]|uniref:Uncharacterized protein n=1 Tax=Beauveria bassiana TaxID=176275 RepID=A0A2S7YKN7_BEABA|nr:hypothetical protein BB8028_0006g10550 [Beauveria bassiana]
MPAAIGGYEIFHYVTDAVLFVTLVASISFTICAAIRLRRRRDQARRVFSWVKISWLIYTIAVFMSLLEMATVTLTSRIFRTTYTSDGDLPDDQVDLVARIATGASALCHCFNVFAEVLVFLTLASFIRCIRLIGPRDDKHPRRHKWSRYCSYGIAFGITILSLAVFSVGIYWIVLSEISSSSSGIAWDRYYGNYISAASIMSLFCESLLAFLAISMLIRSCILRRKLRTTKSLHKPLRYLIACCSLWVVRACFDIYCIVFETVAPDYFAPSVDAATSFNEILVVVFMTWPLFIILVILYYLGLDRKNGLSSTASPLLREDGESHVASSEFSSSEQPSITPIITPMSERANAPALTPVAPRPESLFACDGVIDAPPEYSPPAAQPAVSGIAAPLSAQTPIIRSPVPRFASQSTIEPVRSSEEELHAVSTHQSDIASERAATSPPVDNALQATQTPHHQSLEEHVPQTSSASAAEEDESMGLYHQADGRTPESEMSNPLPSHDEAMGLYHQADGRPPTSEASLSNMLPSHEETMGLFHQADGRPPGTGNSVVPPASSNPVMFQPSGDRPESMTAPPSHDEAMGLYHQADGRVPQSEVLPPEKETQKK